MTPLAVERGNGPVILGQPHGGTFVPEEIAATFNDNGRKLADTDWHIWRLYDGLCDGATVVRANFHRYVIDANRDPEGQSLYPGQNTTGLCPLTDFDSEPIYQPGMEPDESEIARRIVDWHRPYHKALEAEIDRVKALHGHAIVFDCHSIRSRIPFLFDGDLPDFNIGTNDGTTCDSSIERVALDICSRAKGFTHVLNGRFKGGWTTRHYGRPQDGVHAIQMEIAQRQYMDEFAPWNWRDERASKTRLVLKSLFIGLNAFAPQLSGARS
ncbi:MAG: N-formylglutamate deformylase [Rhizobiaceae bacterium]